MTRIVFMGTPDFSVPILRKLIENYNVIGVVTQPDKPKGRKKIITAPPIKEEALRHGIRVIQPTKIREQAQYEEVLALKPDLIVTAAFGQILPKALLDAPIHGCINVHASLLPELRGGAPIHYAILRGKEKTGITIMNMAEKMDAGDILTQSEVEITETDTVGTLHDKLSTIGTDLLMETLPLLLTGKITPIKQDETKVTFAYNIKREQEQIDWTKSGEEIYNHIRGLNPFPGAYTTDWDGNLLKIWASEKVTDVQIETSQKIEPGTILNISHTMMLIATGTDVAINITELQLAGKKRVTIEQFIRTNKIVVGWKLGVEK